MECGVVAIGALLAALSTTVMGYISMATMIGPWIAPTLVLCGALLFRLCGRTPTTVQLTLVTAFGSPGGIIATAMAFSFPTLFFLDPVAFRLWMNNPLSFCLLLGGITLAGGTIGFLVADWCQDRLLVHENLPFPIGRLVYSMIIAQQRMKQAYELVAGFITSIVFSVLQHGSRWVLDGAPLLPRFIPIISKSIRWNFLEIPAIRIDIWPMMWAIGFVTGHVIAIPLGIGAIARILLVNPVRVLWFAGLPESEYLFAFCSGMVICSVFLSVNSIIRTVRSLVSYFRNFLTGQQGLETSFDSDKAVLKTNQAVNLWHNLYQKVHEFFNYYYVHYIINFRLNYSINNGFIAINPLFIALALIGVIGILTWCEFSMMTQLYIVVVSVVCSQQIASIAGKFGIAPLGRFATFAMIPAMLLFRLTSLQIVLIATFVEVSGGVVADLLFGRRMADLAGVNNRAVRRAQFFGIVICTVLIGLIFWILIDRLHLGSDQLFAYRGFNRSVLIQAFLGSASFNFWVFLFGALFAFILSIIGINSTLVLGGLLMDINLSISLIIGGFGSLLTRNRERWEPFWSGVFASDSLLTLIRSILR